MAKLSNELATSTESYLTEFGLEAFTKKMLDHLNEKDASVRINLLPESRVDHHHKSVCLINSIDCLENQPFVSSYCLDRQNSSRHGG